MSIDAASEYFYELTPERILTAVESGGFRCTGRSLALNSMENRVYEVEIEVDQSTVKSRYDAFRVIKFYRPGRWSKEQILEEHAFLRELHAADIPVVAPLDFSPQETLRKIPESNIWYAVFPKVGGRSPDELTQEQAQRIGRLLARLHTVGKTRESKHRLQLSPQTYGLDNLAFLERGGFLPKDLAVHYASVVRQICSISEPWFRDCPQQRIHGDCHYGNVLWSTEGPLLIDFDDMVMGPCVQDLWLLVPGRDEYAKRTLDALLDGYEQMRSFDRSSLRLIEPLRALRFVHFSTWIARRWQDPAFQRAFPQFGTPAYWNEQFSDLREQLGIIQGVIEGSCFVA